MGAVRNSGFEYGHVNRMLPKIPTSVQSQKRGCNKPDFSKETSEKADNKQLYQSVFQTTKRFLPLQKIWMLFQN